jgi:hypothetical protein
MTREDQITTTRKWFENQLNPKTNEFGAGIVRKGQPWTEEELMPLLFSPVKYHDRIVGYISRFEFQGDELCAIITGMVARWPVGRMTVAQSREWSEGVLREILGDSYPKDGVVEPQV